MSPSQPSLHSGVRHYAFGAVAMVLGSTMVLGVVVGMNEMSQPPERNAVERAAAIEVKQAAKPKPKPVPQKPRPKPRNTPKAPPRPALAALGSGLGGIEFDLPGLGFQELGADASNLLSTDKEVVHTAETVDSPPKPVQQAPMQFPKKLQDKGIEGYVVLSVLVNKTGNIERVKVIESKPPAVFDQAAIEGIRQWRFEPATYKGEAVTLWIRQKVRFELQGR